jgi:hypothetical protein
MPGLVMAALLLTYALPVSSLVGLPGSFPRLVSGSVSKIRARPLSLSSSRRPCLSSRRSRGDPGTVSRGPCLAFRLSNKCSISPLEQVFRTSVRKKKPPLFLRIPVRISNRISAEKLTDSQNFSNRILTEFQPNLYFQLNRILTESRTVCR